jgi:hypothetical protein
MRRNKGDEAMSSHEENRWCWIEMIVCSGYLSSTVKVFAEDIK